MNMESETIKILKNKLLIVEGKDEINFFETLLDKKKIQDIQVIESEGKDSFKKFLPELKKLSNFNTVISLAVIQDADNDPKARFDSICSTLKNCDLNPPHKIASFNTAFHPKIGVFIIPDGKSKGMLESLCLSIVKSEEKNTMECIYEFMDCIKSINKEPKNTEKARLQAFLSAMPEDTRSIGIAAQKGYWDFESDKLKPLLDFLKQI